MSARTLTLLTVCLTTLGACDSLSMPEMHMPEFSMPKMSMPQLTTPPAVEPPEQVAARIKQALRVDEVKPTGPNAINVIFTYTGERPIERMTLEAYYNNLNFPAYVTGPIYPQAQFMARFKDPLIDTYGMDFARLSWNVKEAVEAQKGYVKNYGGTAYPSRHR